MFGRTRITKVDLSFPSTPCVSAEAKDLILRVSLLMIVFMLISGCKLMLSVNRFSLPF
jgi:hypothetical protein